MAPISTKINFSQLLTVALIIFFLILPSKTVLGFDRLRHDHDTNEDVLINKDEKSYGRETKLNISNNKKMVLGSRPPGCVNKCLNCRPCTATLVIPSHQKKRLDRTFSHGDDDDSYYLLSWKCRCGTKLFHP